MHPSLVHKLCNILRHIRDRIREIENVEQVAPLYRHHHSTRHSASNRVFDLIGLVLEATNFDPFEAYCRRKPLKK